MAVKTYTVNYNIVTNAAAAVEGFSRLAAAAQEMVAPFKSIATSLTDLSRSIKILKENSAISFTANIQTAEFDAKLKTMVRAVQTASTEMAAAINNALRGDGRAIQGVREAANKALSKSDIRSALTTKQARLKEIVGTKSKGKTGRTVYDKNGLIHQARAMVKNTSLSPSELLKAQNTLSALEQERIALKAETKELQKQLDKLAKPVTAPKSAPVASSSPTTNVTPATIQAWQKHFGNAKNKSLTVQINGNASGPTGALTVIGEIQRKIKEIKGEIPILPKVDEAALATVKEKLSALSKLGTVAVKPVMQNKTGKDVQSKAGGSVAGVATDKGKKTGPAKKGKLLTSNQQQTIDLIGKVTKVELPQKPVSLPVNIKILNKQVNEALKNITPKTLPIRVKFGWEKGAVGKQEQIKGLTNSIPPIKLILNTGEAKAALEGFIALIHGASPQNINLTATGSAPVAGGGVGTATGGRTQRSVNSRGKTGHQAQAEKLRAQAQNSMLPFAQNKEQLNLLTKHRRFFRQAIAKTGISPSVGMAAPQMLQYLQSVSDQMQSASVPVPWALHNQINKLQNNIAKTRGIDSSSKAVSSSGTSQSQNPRVVVRDPARPISNYDRFRKWGFPLTGATSFGSRTPMAVDMAKGMGVMFAIGGAMSAIGGSFSQAMQYQNTMKSTEAILKNSTDNYSPQAFANMEHIIRDVGMKTKFSAPEVASAARFLGMAGFDIDAINASIRTIADMALVGDFDLGETADKMTNIMTTFGYDSKALKAHPEKVREFGNIMASTASRTNTDLMMLAESAKYGGGVAYMYGRNDPNLFAETMALFGVMGNAGIQGSSAGTALRMMYQNIFKPNKNQQKVIDNLEKLGVKITNEDGSKNSMASIISQIAEKVDEKDLSSVIGTLFRITAQPGANAAIMAATSQNAAQLAEMAQEDGSNLQDAAHAVNAVTGQMMSKTGLSTLANLIEANKIAAGSNLLRAQAEPKQNTIEGLWAQVTSTFTEGIVKAFEKRTGGFEEMLIKLRDYLAKPETVRMIQNLLDLIIEVGKALAWFVKLWASLYNMAPGLIATWIKWQMIFTQAGSLITPFIQLSSVFNRLGGSLLALSGMSNTAAASMTRAAAAGRAHAASVAGLPLYFATGTNDTKKIYGAAAWRANKAIHRTNPQSAMNKTAEAIWYGSPIVPILSRQKIAGATYNREAMAGRLQKLNNTTTEHYAAVRERYDRMFGRRRAGRAFQAGRQMMSFKNIFNAAMWAPLLLNLKYSFVALLTPLAKIAGVILTPLTGILVGLTALGFSIWRFSKVANGATESQEIARQRMADLYARGHQKMLENTKWYQDMLDKFKHPVSINMPGKSKEQTDFEGRSQAFKDEFDFVHQGVIKGASDKKTDGMIDNMRKHIGQNNMYKAALGNKYDDLVGKNVKDHMWATSTDIVDWSEEDNDGRFAPLRWIDHVGKIFSGTVTRAENEQRKAIKASLMVSGINTPQVQKAVEDIKKLREKYLKNELTEEQFKIQATAIQEGVVKKEDISEGSNRYMSSDDLTLQQYRDIQDYSQYLEYRLGQYNLLNSMINGGHGTIIAKMDAYYTLKNKLYQTADQYWAAISEVIGDIPVSFNIVTGEGVETVRDLILSMDQRGHVDMVALNQRLQEKVAGVKLTLGQFDTMLASIYDQLAQLGLVEGSEDKKLEFIQRGSLFQKITPESAAQYYHDFANQDETLKKYKDQLSLDQFTSLATNLFSFQKMSDGTMVFGAKIAADMRKNYEKIAAKGKIPGVTPDGTPNPGDGSNGNPYAPSQDPYASSYSRDVAKPTQIVFNIDSVAKFDKTTVGATAEEQDIAYAMEDKIAQTVYRLFAEAANQAQMQSSWS